MPWPLKKKPPLTPQEIQAIKKALAAGVTIRDVQKRFHRAAKLILKLYKEVLFAGRDGNG